MNSNGYQPGNILVTGSTRSGKSTAELLRIVAAAMLMRIAIVVIDPHPNSLARSALRHLVARGHERRIIFDELTHLSRVPGYGFLQPPNFRDPLRRHAAIQQTVDEFADVLCRRREMQSLATAPQTEEWVNHAGMLLLHQPQPRPASDLRYAFQVGSDMFEHLVQSCTHEETQLKFQEVARRKIARGQFAAAERLITGVCGSVPFAIRCGTSFSIPKFISKAGILLVEGGSQGISEDAARTIMGSIVLQVIRYVRGRKHSTPRVLLVLDEATNAGLIGATGHEVRAMAETQKMGLDFHVLVQSPNFSSPYTTDAIFTNCVRHEWFFAANDAVARLAASDLGDPYYRDKVRDLRTGERYVKHKTQVFLERVQMLEDPWVFPGLAEKKSEIALQEIRKRPEFEDAKWLDNLSHLRVNETAKSLSERSNMSASSDTSTSSSPLKRLRTAASRHSENPGNSESSEV